MIADQVRSMQPGLAAVLSATTFFTFVREFSPLVCVLKMSSARRESRRHRNLKRKQGTKRVPD